jgi:hypothetical protein
MAMLADEVIYKLRTILLSVNSSWFGKANEVLVLRQKTMPLEKTIVMFLFV